MLIDQRLPELRESFLRMLRDDELIGIGATIVRNSNRFPAPDQPGAALSKTLPTADRCLAWVPIRRSVPTFHRLHRNTVGYLQATAKNWLEQRRILPMKHFFIARNLHVQRMYVLSESACILQAGKAHNGRIHAILRFFGRRQTAEAPSNAIPTSTTQP